MIYRHPLPSSAQNSGFLIMVDLLCMLTVLTPREWSWGSWSCFKSSNSYVACCCHGPTIISGLSLVTHIENYALVGSTVFFLSHGSFGECHFHQLLMFLFECNLPLGKETFLGLPSLELWTRHVLNGAVFRDWEGFHLVWGFAIGFDSGKELV